jgi:predicted dehydrogenase
MQATGRFLHFSSFIFMQGVFVGTSALHDRAGRRTTMSQSTIDRREFISTGLGLAASLAPASVRARGPNDRIGIGVIGCGSRGNYLLGETFAAAADRVDIVAVADVWSVARNTMAKRVAGTGGRPAPRLFARYHDLLAMPQVDAVIVATPDFAHPAVLVDAVKAGKDAFVEKPLSARLEDAVAAVDAVKSSTRIVQVGTQRRSSAQFKAAAEYVRSGALGPICKIETAWNRNVPSWARPVDDVRAEDVDWEQFQMHLERRPFDPVRLRSWQWFYQQTTGLVGLLGSHLIDVAQWFMDDPFPSSAVALGGRYTWKDGREISDTAEYVLEYPKGWLCTFSSRLGSGPETDYTVFYGKTRTLDTRDWVSRPADNKRPADAKDITLPAVADERSHVGNWIDCLASRAQPNAPIEVGYSHAVACCLAREAERTGRRMRYDSTARKIVETT